MSGKVNLGTPPIYLPTVSNTLNKNVKKSPYQALLLAASISLKIMSLVSPVVPGKTMKVTRNTMKIAKRKVQA